MSYTQLEKDWAGASSESDKLALIKKYSLTRGISSLRPGEVKLGIANDLKLSPKKEVAALDGDNELIFISGYPPKIRYPGAATSSLKTEGADDEDSDDMDDDMESDDDTTDSNEKDSTEVTSDSILAIVPSVEYVKDWIENNPDACADRSVEDCIRGAVATYCLTRLNESGCGTKSSYNEEDGICEQSGDIEKEWLSTDNEQTRKELIKKHNLQVGISKLRPGEIKLGIKNSLNGKATFHALDADNNLIAISGTSSAPKIKYVKGTQKEAVASARGHRIVELVTGQKDASIRESFIASLGDSDPTKMVRKQLMLKYKKFSETLVKEAVYIDRQYIDKAIKEFNKKAISFEQLVDQLVVTLGIKSDRNAIRELTGHLHASTDEDDKLMTNANEILGLKLTK